LLVFVALLILLAATVAVAYVDLGFLNPILTIAIAVIKALLILLFFMHLRYSSALTWIVAMAGFFWLGILLVLSMSDFLTRFWVPSLGG
jgi:cytochrome c oxidase subunit 4